MNVNDMFFIYEEEVEERKCVGIYLVVIKVFF